VSGLSQARLSTSDLSVLTASLRGRERRLYGAALAVAPPARDAWWVVLAFRRAVRDAVRGESKGLVDDLAARLERAFDRRPASAPLDRGLAWLADAHDMPRACFDAQLEAAAWDLDARRYHTEDALLRYAVRASGSVAILAACAMGRRRQTFLERAVDLGVALELTRVASSVLADGGRGRVYLPIEWLEEAGVDVDRFVAHAAASAALSTAIARVASLAERFYLRADGGLADVPHLYRPLVRSARWLGVAELRGLAETGFDAGRSPPASPLRTGAILLRALRAGVGERGSERASRLQGGVALIDAAAR